MKKILSLVLVLVLCIGLLPMGALAVDEPPTVCSAHGVSITLTPIWEQF